jgi:hypothetical protein
MPEEEKAGLRFQKALSRVLKRSRIHVHGLVLAVIPDAVIGTQLDYVAGASRAVSEQALPKNPAAFRTTTHSICSGRDHPSCLPETRCF